MDACKDDDPVLFGLEKQRVGESDEEGTANTAKNNGEHQRMRANELNSMANCGSELDSKTRALRLIPNLRSPEIKLRLRPDNDRNAQISRSSLARTSSQEDPASGLAKYAA